MDMNTLSTALKRYTASRQKNLSLMMEYAKTFHIEKALRQYMEVLNTDVDDDITIFLQKLEK